MRYFQLLQTSQQLADAASGSLVQCFTGCCLSWPPLREQMLTIHAVQQVAAVRACAVPCLMVRPTVLPARRARHIRDCAARVDYHRELPLRRAQQERGVEIPAMRTRDPRQKSKVHLGPVRAHLEPRTAGRWRVSDQEHYIRGNFRCRKTARTALQQGGAAQAASQLTRSPSPRRAGAWSR